MHADREDAPYYIQAKRGQSKHLIAIIAIGIAVTLGAIMLVPGPSGIEAPASALKPAASLPQRPPVLGKSVHPAPAPQITYQPQAVSPPAKRTDFNDSNYVPRGADNVVSYPKTVEMKQPEKQKMKVVVVGRPERRLRDYCPHREGSIEQRNCRMQMDLSRND